MKITAIIAAGGMSSRMAGKNKLLEQIGGKSLIARTTGVFLGMEEITGVIVVAAKKWMDEYSKVLAQEGMLDKVRMTEGGENRTESVYYGLQEADKDTDIVLVHDAARPLVTERIIRDCIAGAVEHGACCAAVPLTDTLKESDGRGFVKRTLERDRLFRIQTPQAFIYKDILKLHKKAAFRGLGVSDDAQIAEYFGYRIYLVESEFSNIKITTQEDLVVAEALLSSRDDAGAQDSLAPADVC
ncbi:MAG: 2-C-methyl-D-erythritol 4-phosphate cytidylyltransferase [Clostridia bacterium]|nr:2-C-methyl-D-erythritol 4-phosphate cytidylyltransferase [Clostridia bacterium]